ncbi:MAG: ubiquitin family protein, partial [Chloroflexota bacterium]
MSARAYIPTPFRHLTGGQAKIEVEAGTVQAVLEQLESRFPGLRERVLDPSGEILHHVNLYINRNPVEEVG